MDGMDLLSPGCSLASVEGNSSWAGGQAGALEESHLRPRSFYTERERETAAVKENE